MIITVRATQVGFDGMQRRRTKEIFKIEESQFSERWMEKKVNGRWPSDVAAEDSDGEDERVGASASAKKGKGPRQSDQSKI